MRKQLAVSCSSHGMIIRKRDERTISPSRSRGSVSPGPWPTRCFCVLLVWPFITGLQSLLASGCSSALPGGFPTQPRALVLSSVHAGFSSLTLADASSLHVSARLCALQRVSLDPPPKQTTTVCVPSYPPSSLFGTFISVWHISYYLFIFCWVPRAAVFTRSMIWCVCLFLTPYG